MKKYNYIDLSLCNEAQLHYYKDKIIKFIQEDNSNHNQIVNFIKYMDFKFHNYISFVLVTQENDIICFSSAKRIAFWSNSIARIYNRFYMSKVFRSKGLSGYNKSREERGYELVHPIYNMMISKCKIKNIKVVVVTRENKGSYNAIEEVHRTVNAHDPFKRWQIHSDYILTCNYPEKQQCWQRVCFLDFENNNSHLINEIPCLSQEEYKKKF